MRTSILVIDNNIGISKYISKILASPNRQLTLCSSGSEALQHLHEGNSPRLTLLANDLSDFPTGELISEIHGTHARTNIILMSSPNGYCDLRPMVRAGVRGFLPKPFTPEQLLKVVDGFSSHAESPKNHEAVEIKIGAQTSLVYASQSIRNIQEQAALVAPFNLPVLILGESGTGKEVIAHYIHSLSRQAKNTFLKVNCAAVPSELLESELFGYEQGAFTGAGHAKPGKFKLADGGTMFLDEIGEMHPSLQAKLLQVLQDGTFTPLGGRTSIKVNVRVIAATNIDIKAAIAQRTFREDLYYRLNGFCFTLPPLRDRQDDIPVLAHYFLKRHSQELGIPHTEVILSPRLIQACMRYSWPGNLRELEAFIKRYLVLQDEQLMFTELAREIADQSSPVNLKLETVLNALRESGGNRREAAKALAISYKRLLYTLRDFGLEKVTTPLI